MLNVVVVRGKLSRPVEERVLPSGDRLATVDVTIPADPDAAGGATRAESVPLAWFDPPAWLVELGVGDELTVSGRVRRRFYQRAGTGLQSRTEVVVEAGAPARRPAKVAEIVRRASELIVGTAAVSCEPGPTEAWTVARPKKARRRAAPTFP